MIRHLVKTDCYYPMEIVHFAIIALPATTFLLAAGCIFALALHQRRRCRRISMDSEQLLVSGCSLDGDAHAQLQASALSSST